MCLGWPQTWLALEGSEAFWVLSDFLQVCLTFCIFRLPDYPDPDNFTWEKYLKETGASAVPAWAFKVVSVTSSAPPHLGRNLAFLHCQVFAFMISPGLGFGSTLRVQKSGLSWANSLKLGKMRSMTVPSARQELSDGK